MHFDVEIAFSGICFFDIQYKKSENGCCYPESCTVLLVDATEDYRPCPNVDLGPRAPGLHTPRMSIPARNFIVGPTDPPRYPLTVSGNGDDHILIDLQRTCVSLSTTCDYRSPLYVPQHRVRGGFAKPEDSGARSEWYDWIAILREIEPGIGNLKQHDCTFPPESSVISCIHFSQGDLENLELGQARGENLVFEFRKFCGESVEDKQKQQSGEQLVCYPRCLADRMVLRFRGLKQPLAVTITDRDPTRKKEEQRSGTFGIGASRAERRTHGAFSASITNLDQRYHPSARAIDDFLWYYELFDWCGSPKPVWERIIPWQQASKHSGHTPSEGNCPPGGG